MRKSALAVGACVLLLGAQAGAGTTAEVWNSYLDYAYVYSSAESVELSARLEGY